MSHIPSRTTLIRTASLLAAFGTLAAVATPASARDERWDHGREVRRVVVERPVYRPVHRPVVVHERYVAPAPRVVYVPRPAPRPVVYTPAPAPVYAAPAVSAPIGTIGGAIAGAVVGSALGHGDGRIATTAIGAVAGALFGSALDR